MTCTGVTHILHKEKKICEEFQCKILISDCCFVANVGGSEKNVPPLSTICIWNHSENSRDR